MNDLITGTYGLEVRLPTVRSVISIKPLTFRQKLSVFLGELWFCAQMAFLYACAVTCAAGSLYFFARGFGAIR